MAHASEGASKSRMENLPPRLGSSGRPTARVAQPSLPRQHPQVLLLDRCRRAAGEGSDGNATAPADRGRPPIGFSPAVELCQGIVCQVIKFPAHGGREREMATSVMGVPVVTSFDAVTAQIGGVIVTDLSAPRQTFDGAVERFDHVEKQRQFRAHVFLGAQCALR